MSPNPRTPITTPAASKVGMPLLEKRPQAPQSCVTAGPLYPGTAGSGLVLINVRQGEGLNVQPDHPPPQLSLIRRQSRRHRHAVARERIFTRDLTSGSSAGRGSGEGLGPRHLPHLLGQRRAWVAGARERSGDHDGDAQRRRGEEQAAVLMLLREQGANP